MSAGAQRRDAGETFVLHDVGAAVWVTDTADVVLPDIADNEAAAAPGATGGDHQRHLPRVLPRGNASSLMTNVFSFGESVHDPGPVAMALLAGTGVATIRNDGVPLSSSRCPRRAP